MNKSVLLSYGIKLFFAVILAIGISACDDDSHDCVPEPTPGFKLHIGEGNVVEMDMDAPDYYPAMYKAVLVMEDMPADEKIIYLGGVYSTSNPEPDLNDYTLIYDYSDYDDIQNWNWEEPLYWGCSYILHPLPATTYYLRGFVQTNKERYYSNTIEVRSRHTNPIEAAPDAYEIPVIFHLFPDAEGNYPVKDQVIKDQMNYANIVFGNYYKIPGQIDTGVRFVPATQAPDGSTLSTPGIIHETEPVEIDFSAPELDEKNIWDMELALNVWVCPIRNASGIENEYTTLGGFTFLPFFDPDETLEGCTQPVSPDIVTGIFLNSIALQYANNEMTFAHEAGHFLGLEHVFVEEDDFCEDTPWYDYAAHKEAYGNDIYLTRTDRDGKEFWSDNIMDYDFGFMTGITPDQRKRIRHTLQYGYFIPGQAGKNMPATRAGRQPLRFVGKPIM